MSDLDIDLDDWNLLSYHEDIQDAATKQYAKLLYVFPTLGEFRAPSSSDSTHIKSIFSTLRVFMTGYPHHFIDYADIEFERPSSQIGQQTKAAPMGKMRRLINPLYTFSKRLEEGLKRAEEEAEDDQPSLELGSDFDIEPPSSFLREVDELAKEKTTSTTTAVGLGSHFVDGTSRASFASTKRPSTIAVDSTSPKRICAFDPTKIPGVTNPFRFEPRSFSRTISADSDSTTVSTVSTSTSVSNTTITTSFPSIGDITTIAQPFFGRDKLISRPSSPVRTAKAPIDVTSFPYQAALNKANVNYFVQWELHRRISDHPTITWDDIEYSDLDGLKGTAADVEPKIGGILEKAARRNAHGITSIAHFSESLSKPTSERKARMLSEVDKEEASIINNDLRGVGNDSPDWGYGGRIMFNIDVAYTEIRSEHIQPNVPTQSSNAYRPMSRTSSNQSGPLDLPDNPLGPVSTKAFPFKMTLRPPDMPGKSHRLGRRFGSRRIINLKIKNVPSEHRQALQEMLVGRLFVVLGRPYRCLWATPDGQTVFAVETNEVGVIGSRKSRCEPDMPSYLELQKMYNDLEQKPNQAMAKWAARLQILFSDSVPATTVLRSAISVVPDIETIEAQLAGHASTEQILTDGCGLMSESLAMRIFRCPHLTFTSGRPSVVQVRLGGSKGLLALMSPSQALEYPGKEVVLRKSMVKALSALEFSTDPSLLTIDVVRCESLKIGASLSSEAMIAMNHNGVPSATFVRMAEEGLNTLRDAFVPRPLEGESEDDVLARIHASCFRQGGVGMERKKRLAKAQGKSAKVAGLVKKWSNDEAENDMSDDQFVVGAGERFDVDPVSGQPGSLAEATMEVVSSGFNPSRSAYAASKLHHLVDTLSTKMIREFRIPVEASLTAFIVPDSLQILEPHEIFVSFSGRGPIDPITQCPMSYLEGDVLGYRSPCKVPTDVRKFTAVYKPELAHLKDCIVLSANSQLCYRSPASFLGGGDYDGDTLTLFWGDELVRDFKNANDGFAVVPEGFEADNFDKEVVQGTQFLREVEGLTEEETIANMQYWLLGAVKGDELTGKYSDLHGNAVYTLGYDHPETIRLAQMFCHVLDARKSGLKVKKDIRSRDSKTYGGQLEWRAWKKSEENGGGKNPVILSRGRGLKPFIMDLLMSTGIEKQQHMMAAFPSEPQLAAGGHADLLKEDYRDLQERWQSLQDQATGWHDGWLQAQLGVVEQHVRACYEIYKTVKSSRCEDVDAAYESAMLDKLVQASPRKKALHSSPSKRKMESTGSNLEILGKVRRLAMIFREQPSKDEIPLIAMWGDDMLREVKVSCLSGMPKGQRKQRQLIPFELDFVKTCEMKAKARAGAGVKSATCTGTKTVLSHIWTGMKPSYKGIEGA